MKPQPLRKSAAGPPPRDVHAARRRSFAIGFALAITNTLIGAFQPVVVRYGAVNLDPLLFAAGPVVVAAICVVPTLYLMGELHHLFEPRYLTKLVMVSMAGTVMTTLTLVYGLEKINAVAGVLLLQSEPVYSLLLATMIVGERPSIRQLLATTVIIAGIGSVFGGAAFRPIYAALLVLFTPFFWQTAHVLSLEVMPPLSPTCITGARYVYSAVVLAALVIILRPAALSQLADAHALALIIPTGVVIFFISSLTWYGAISRLSLAWTTALVVPGVPVLSIIFAIIFLGEHATIREVAGVAIAMSGIIALVTGADPHRKPIEAAEAIHQPLG
jgi:drug/metabolite transporter (DMT)-like permease